MRTAHVITCSDRASSGVYEDRSGALLAELLSGRFTTSGPQVVPDDRAAIAAAIRAAGTDVVITTGGTGLGPRDVTPEATMDVADRVVPGIAERLRAASVATVPTAVLSRGVAVVTGRTLVVNLPGSVGGVRDGMAELLLVLDHACDQISGGDHA